MSQLDSHLRDAGPSDLVLIAYHDGRAYSVTVKDADFMDLDREDLILGLQRYAIGQSLRELLSIEEHRAQG